MCIRVSILIWFLPFFHFILELCCADIMVSFWNFTDIMVSFFPHFITSFLYINYLLMFEQNRKKFRKTSHDTVTSTLYFIPVVISHWSNVLNKDLHMIKYIKRSYSCFHVIVFLDKHKFYSIGRYLKKVFMNIIEIAHIQNMTYPCCVANLVYLHHTSDMCLN